MLQNVTAVCDRLTVGPYRRRVPTLYAVVLQLLSVSGVDSKLGLTG